MVHFLRNERNETIIECETSSNDLSSSVDIRIYSEELLSLTMEEDQWSFIEDITRLSKLRQIWFENDPEEDEDLDSFIRGEYEIVATKWDFIYVGD